MWPFTSSGGKSKEAPATEPKPSVMETIPVPVQAAGLSGVSGYTAGFAAKRAFKVLVFTAGCFFISMQVMASNGYISVHFDKMEDAFNETFDLNGDGKTDGADAQEAQDRLKKRLGAGVPCAASFGAGFLFGLRS
jgi:uncharacterized membrane protein (Fun14 family)